MNEPDNGELLIFALKTVGICAVIYLAVRLLCVVIRRLDPRMNRWIAGVGRKRELLEERYSAYSTGDLLQLLQDLESKRLLEMTAALNVAERRIQDERIRLLVQKLQNSKIYAIKVRAKTIIKKWESKGN